MLESVRALYLGELSNLIYSIYVIGEPFAGRARERVLTLYERKTRIPTYHATNAWTTECQPQRFLGMKAVKSRKVA